MKRLNSIFKHTLILPLLAIGGALTAQNAPDAPAAASGPTDWLAIALLSAVGALALLIAVEGYVLAVLSKGLRKKIFDNAKKAAPVLVGFMVLMSSSLFAQEAGGEAHTPQVTTQNAMYIVLGVIIALELAISLAMFFYIRLLANSLIPEDARLEAIPQTDGTTWKATYDKIMGLYPMSREQDIMTDHDYDGIKELDNRMPPWLRSFFNVTIGFAVLYLGYYHVLGWGKFQLEEYADEVKAGEMQKLAYLSKSGSNVNENTVVALTDKVALSDGKFIFEQNCATCHGKLGEGTAGPNLTDDYWKNGDGGIKSLFKIVTHGVPNTAMKIWEKDLLPVQIQQVTSYILTLRGTNPPNAKAPEGNLVTQ